MSSDELLTAVGTPQLRNGSSWQRDDNAILVFVTEVAVLFIFYGLIIL